MGEFDFGKFQELYDYIISKLNEGGALTPEEQKAYDALMDIANQGLDLTNTADFNALYKAFNALADSETKQKFEELYGTGLLQDPASSTISFTRPGTLVAAMMRRGMSVRDGPVQALLSEGMKNFLDTTAKNSFAAMTNSYAAMTPIRAQNIQAATNAGNLAAQAIGRRVPVAASAVSGGRAGSGGGGAGEGPGGPEIRLPIPPAPARTGPEEPDIWDRILPGLLTALATGGLGVLSPVIRDLFRDDPNAKKGNLGEAYGPNERPPGGGSEFPGLQNDPDYFEKLTEAPGDTTAEPADYTNRAERLDINPYQIDQSAYKGDENQIPSWLGANDPYQIDMAAYGGYQQPQDPYQGMDPTQYYGMSDQPWSQPMQQSYDYQDYYQPPQQDWYQPPPPQEYDYDYSNYDWGQDYTDWGGGGWDYDYNDYGGGGGGGYDDYNYNDYSYDIPSSGGDWYSENW